MVRIRSMRMRTRHPAPDDEASVETRWICLLGGEGVVSRAHTRASERWLTRRVDRWM